MTDPDTRPSLIRERRAWLPALLCGFALAALAPAPAAGQGKADTGTIRGRIVDESTGGPIATALIEFMDARGRTSTTTVADEEGQFVLAGVPTGRFRLRTSRIGYAPALTPYWYVEPGDLLTVAVYLDPEAVLLAPLEITARERSRSPVLSGFYGRVERAIGGTFITRQDIERRKPSLISDLLMDVPGVRLSAGGIGANSRTVSIARAVPIRGGACPVQIWVDGMLATRGGDVPLDDLATPAILEGIEIYRGLATIPPEFVTPEARCGVIALWTQRGG